MRTRTEHLAALADVTADDIAATMDEAATEDDYYTALHSSLLAVGYPGILQAPEERPISSPASLLLVSGVVSPPLRRHVPPRPGKPRHGS